MSQAAPASVSGDEAALIGHFIQNGAVVFDVSSAPSAWADVVRRSDRKTQSHDLTPAALAAGGIDGYCRERGVRHIHFLRLASGTPADVVLAGAALRLRRARIDVVQIDPCADPGPACRRLANDDYRFYLARGNQLAGPLSPEDAAAAAGQRLLALHPRVTPFFINHPQPMLDLPGLCRRHGIQPRGVIHLGANEAGELAVYREMGVQTTLYVEANPDIAASLRKRLADQGDVVIAHCAISDHAGPVQLHVASNHQCSSILPMRRHQEIYPDVVETRVVTVDGRTVDGLLTELALEPTRFNLLNIDIQGAELLALRGAAATLPHIDAIQTEVNFDELYEGNAQIDDLDDFLEPLGFRRVALACPFHPAWGDAFYVRAAPPPAPAARVRGCEQSA